MDGIISAVAATLHRFGRHASGATAIESAVIASGTSIAIVTAV